MLTTWTQPDRSFNLSAFLPDSSNFRGARLRAWPNSRLTYFDVVEAPPSSGAAPG